MVLSMPDREFFYIWFFILDASSYNVDKILSGEVCINWRMMQENRGIENIEVKLLEYNMRTRFDLKNIKEISKFFFKSDKN